MAYADDIGIGEYSVADFEDELSLDCLESRRARKSPSVDSIVPGLTLSVVLHLALASGALYMFAMENRVEKQPGPGALRVAFVFPSELLPPVVEPQTDSEQESAAVAPTTTQEEASASPLGDTREVGEFELGRNGDNAVQAETAFEFELGQSATPEKIDRPMELISIPSADSVRSAIVATRDDPASPMQGQDCSRTERERPFTLCDPQEQGDYSAATRNSTYEFFNPGIDVVRSARAVTEIAKHSERVSRSLSLSNVPAGLSNYVLEEVEQGIETYSNRSVRALGHMNTLVDKSAAGAMARRLFDPWVLQQSEKLRAGRAQER